MKILHSMPTPKGFVLVMVNEEEDSKDKLLSNIFNCVLDFYNKTRRVKLDIKFEVQCVPNNQPLIYINNYIKLTDFNTYLDYVNNFNPNWHRDIKENKQSNTYFINIKEAIT